VKDTTVTITTDSPFAQVSSSPTPFTWQQKIGYECCTSEWAGICWDYSTCYHTSNFDVYVVKIGYPKYWENIDTAQNTSGIEWKEVIQQGQQKTYTIKLTGSAANKPFYIRNLKSYAGGEIVSIQVSNPFTNCTARNATTGVSTCDARTQDGLLIGKPGGGIPSTEIRVVYTNNSSTTTGTAIVFEIHIPK
jgi:hypothetical protein